MNRQMSIGFVLLWLGCAYLSCAQAQGPTTFSEATPPPGLVKGHIKVGNRYGALIAGGKTVYSNDVFTVTTHGHKVNWKVLEVSEKTTRFACEVSNSAMPPPANSISDLGTFIMPLEEGAQAYKTASTRALKDQVIEETRKCASDWCTSNRTLRIKGTLSDLTAFDDGTALLRVKDIDCGPFSAIRRPNLFVNFPFQFTLSMSKEQSVSFKAGDAVVLTGCPMFHPGTGMLIAHNLIMKPTVTCFMVPGEVQMIGALTMSDIKYEIFDPKAETVHRK